MRMPKSNKQHFKGVTILLFVLGMMVGGLLNYFFENRKYPKCDIDESFSISQNMQQNLEQLETFVDLAITRYCGEKGIENQYTFQLLEDMLHFYTYIDAQERYTYDLNKTILPDMANDRFLVRAKNGDSIIYVEVNTYRMKLYVYEEEQIDRIGRVRLDPRLDKEEAEEFVKCDWPKDMWDKEYYPFVYDGWEYLETPDFDSMLSMNPDLYGMVIYSLQRYCKEQGIQEMFHFEFPEDKVSEITVRIFTVKVTSDNRMLYMDIDLDRNKVHIYQVE